MEIVTYFEAKFGLRILDSRPSDTVTRGHFDTMDFDTVNSLSSGKGKGSSSPRDGCLKCRGAKFQRDSHARRGNGKQSSGKGKLRKSWSKSESKGHRTESNGEPKGKSKGSNGAKGSYKGNTSKSGLSGLEHPKSETSSETLEPAQTYPTDTSHGDNSWCDDGWSHDEWNDDWSSVGWHEGWEQTHDNSACSFSLGCFDLGAMSSLQRIEKVNENLGTGTAVTTFPLNLGPDGAGYGSFYRTASGVSVSFSEELGKVTMETVCRSLNGRLAGVHKVLSRAGEIACKGRKDF